MRLWERFPQGRATAFPRLTSDETLRQFLPNPEGLRVLLVNVPIREWAFPNIGPLGQEYIGAVAMMDGHDVRVLDLNAERGGPVEADARFRLWTERRLEQAIDAHAPDVIGWGGIITQYTTIRRLMRVARSARPQAKIMLGGGIASCLPAFMATRLPVDAVIQEEGEVTVSEVLARWEAGGDLEGVLGVAHQLPGGQICDHGHRPSVKAGADGLDHLPWPLRSLWPEDQVYKRNPVGHLNWESKWTGGAPTADTPFSVSMIASRGCPYAAKACDYAIAPDTPILRPDLSWTPASELKRGDTILTVTEQPAGAGRRWIQGTVEAVLWRQAERFRIETTGGSVVGSKEHPWLTRRPYSFPVNWTETRDLKLGYELATILPPEQTANCASEDYQRGYIKGLFEGEGTFHRGRWRGRMWPHTRIAMADPEPLDRFQAYCANFGIRTWRGPFIGNTIRPMEKVHTRGVESINTLDELLAAPVDTSEAAKGYLAGIYDGEGTFYKGHQQLILRIYQKPGRIYEEICAALDLLKLHFSRRTHKSKTCKGGEIMALTCLGGASGALRFLQMIQPAIPRKCDFTGVRLGRDWATITKIIPLGPGPLLDLQTTARTFVAGPIISHNCYASYLGATYRLRSPSEVVDEMAYLVKRYQARYVHFLDDLLLTDYRWALAFAEEILRRKLDVTWGGTCRTNIAADDVLRARREGRPHMLERAHEAGMRHVGYGVESASPIILKNIDKSGQTLEKMELAILETQRVMGYADCSFMVASPGETEATVRETVDFCKRVGLRPEVFFFTTAYPGTTFWQLALDRGLIRQAVTGELGPADDDLIEQYFIRLGEQGEQVRTNFSDLPDGEIEALARWAVTELNPSGSRIREPHSGDAKGLVGATRADL